MKQLARDGNHLKPKYQQLADLIISDIEEGQYAINDRIPSVNKLSRYFKLSRETVLKSLTFLSEQGVIRSAYRQGYFVKNTNVKVGPRIFLLMDKITEFKNRMYNAFLNTIGDQGNVHLFFYHHNYEIFKSLITQNIANYTHFVIVTYLREDVSEILNMIPPEKRLILDHHEPKLTGDYAMVYQDFEVDTYNCMLECYSHLRNYKKIVLVCAESRYEGGKITKGFRRFCKEKGLDSEVAEDVSPSNFTKRSAYILLSPDDAELVELIKIKREHNLEFGKDIGIISYNDTYVNEVLEGGISVFSTDFTQMGRNAALLILNKQIKTVENPSKLVLRNSL